MKKQLTISQLNRFSNLCLQTFEKNNIDLNEIWHIDVSKTHQTIKYYAYYSKEFSGHLSKHKFVANIDQEGTIRMTRSLVTIVFLIVKP